jgi:hypothetical protein
MKTVAAGRFICVLFLFSALARSSAQDSAATVSGYVTSSGTRVAGAEITVRGSKTVVSSGDDGAFRITGLSAGVVVLDEKRLGYVAEEFRLVLEGNQDRRVNLVLDKVAQALPQVTVTDIPGKPARLAQSHKNDEFYIRKATGIGTFITREEIDQVFVDGQFSSDCTDRLEQINPAEIEAIEIYKGPSQLPAIARGKGCGAIFIWLRDGSR